MGETGGSNEKIHVEEYDELSENETDTLSQNSNLSSKFFDPPVFEHYA